MWIYKFLPIFLLQTQAYANHWSVIASFGAVGDGKTDDTQAIRKALATAASNGGGRVVFDAGHTFLTGPFNITSNIILDVQGKILGSSNTTEYNWNTRVWHPLIRADKAQNITVLGGGVIDGNGGFWWTCAFDTAQYPCSNKQRPTLFEMRHVDNLIVHSVTFQNSPMFHIPMKSLTNVHLYNITISSPVSARNTDGIDVSDSNGILIENSYISVGDVAMTISGGTQNAVIRNLVVGTSHGLALGSNTDPFIRNVTFDNITIFGSDRLDTGPNIISQPGRGGNVSDITYSNIKMYNMGYCISISMNFSQSANTANYSIPHYNNIKMHDILCQNASNGWTLEGLEGNPIQANFYNIQMVNVQNVVGTCKNIVGTCDKSTVSPYCPPCIGTSG